MEIQVSEIIGALNLNVINKNEADTKKKVKSTNLTRQGLALAGKEKAADAYKSNIIGWGTHESRFLSSLNIKEVSSLLHNVLGKETPGIVLSGGFKKNEIYDILLEVANEYKIAVIRIDKHLSEISMKFSQFFIDFNKEEVRIHGSLINVNGFGVLIIGKSGIGKSEAILELIQKGHVFVSDDTVKARLSDNHVIGRSSKLTRDLLEVRGIGILNIPFVYGIKSSASSTRINMVVELVGPEELDKLDRLGNSGLKYRVLEKDLPLIKIPTGNSRNMSSLIEAAAAVVVAKNNGMDPLRTIQTRKGK